MKYFFLSLLVIFLGQPTMSQNALGFPQKKYPNTFRNPLATPFSLVGNFGECRPNHFHSGIDVRTDGKENKSVYAIEDGYVSRVHIEPGGFGNAIFINHVGGYTSVYAHLNTFFPKLEEYVRKKQYEAESWAIDLTFFPDQFMVRKGSFIALSGNTGSSQGPHLHLEIRNAKTEAPLNPLLFFNEIEDDKKPIIKQLAIYDGRKSIYEQSPILHKLSGGILTKKMIEVGTDKVYFGIVADDFMKIATGTLGVYEMRLYVNNQPTFAWQMDHISYDITRYMNAHADYKTKKKNGPWIQLCTQLPNDRLSIYKSTSNERGLVDVSDGSAKEIRIEIYDTKYNKSTLSFSIKGTQMGNTLTCAKEFVAGKPNVCKTEHISFSLNEDALYDNICFRSYIAPGPNEYTYLYQVHENEIPLHSYFELQLKPKKEIPASYKGKVALVLSKKSNGVVTKKGLAAAVVNGKVVASVREFGIYEIAIDQTPPVITSKLKDQMNISKEKVLYFTIKDDITSVKKCTATVDGQWLRLVQKGQTYYYEFDKYFPSGSHALKITATDENNNSSEKIVNLIR
ncbi:MAG: peptidoglycan DD-metalloendopeptidase family protein [Bacteroidetes bacterium]|nr:peptidoglycan DD-metalloendopeptidase family protein [Bacteroidota bacterium]